TGDLEVVAAEVLDGRRGEGDGRELLDVQEVVGAQVTVALPVAGVDAGDLDGEVDRRVLRVLAVERCRALELVERAPHLGHHRVPGHEADAAVGDVEGVGTGQLGEAGGCGGHDFR